MTEKKWLTSWSGATDKKLNYMSLPITEVFSKYAAEHPDKTALDFYGYKITYGKLDQLSASFAASLSGLGVSMGDRISLYMENCPQFIIALLGGWKIGAIMVPSNPMFLGEELVYQLTDAGCETIIMQDDLFPVFDSVRVRTPVTNVIVTNRQEFLPANPALTPHHTLVTASNSASGAMKFPQLLSMGYNGTEIKPRLDDVALLQYSSGTNGMPKGAMITHGNLMHNAVGCAAWLGAQPEDTHLAVLPLFELAGLVPGMSMPFYSGGKVILLARYDTECVLEAIEKYQCTHWASITTMKIAVINYPDIGRWNLTSLRYCLTGGSPVPLEVRQAFTEQTGADLIEGYGLSETTSQITLNPPHQSKPGSVGIPVFETKIKIVDINDPYREVPQGTEGELIVKGPQVMKGYWNRPGETRLTIRDGWFSTGDVARVDSDGYIYIVGRKRDIIKPSGFLVFPQEVEKLIYQHPAVAEVVVAGIPDPYRVETVKAFIVLRQEYVGTISEEDIIQWSRHKIAAYKYPRVVEFVSELPHNGTGEVKRCFIRGKDSLSEC